MAMKRGGVDFGELHDRMKRQRRYHRGSRWFDLGDRELSDGERAEMLEAVHATSGFEAYPFQETVKLVGQEAHRAGRSFDESLLSYYRRYVE
jgi:hypothetical protein